MNIGRRGQSSTIRQTGQQPRRCTLALDVQVLWFVVDNSPEGRRPRGRRGGTRDPVAAISKLRR
jgi:hypothetical protein